MDKFLAKLERRYGQYALGNFTFFWMALQIVAFILTKSDPLIFSKLTLHPEAIKNGELWRLLTWVVLPVSKEPYVFLFSIYSTYFIGTALEREWGSLKFEIYWLVGFLATLVAGMLYPIGQQITHWFLLTSLFLAYATLWPYSHLRIFFVLPIEVRWLGLIDAIYILYSIGQMPGFSKILPIIAVLNYLLFFHDTLWRLCRHFFKRANRARHFSQLKHQIEMGQSTERCCAICKASYATSTDLELRVCNCEKCVEPTEFCKEHLHSH